MDIAITGASGFIGKNLVESLDNKANIVSQPTNNIDDPQYISYLDQQLKGVSYLIHCAGYAHSRQPIFKSVLRLVIDSNYGLTELIANRAVENGVKTFVYLSTAHVYGQSSNEILTEGSPLNPANIYAESKLLAERALMEIAARSTMRVIIMRLPLVYGPHVKANFLTLLKLVSLNLALPFGLCNTPRSYLYVGNLTHAIQNVLTSDMPSGIYNIADTETLSTADLITQLAELMHFKAKLYNVPPIWLTSGLKIIGKKGLSKALCEPLVLDSRKLQTSLNWRPPVSQKSGLEATAQWFINR